jgi:hypothetical protein
MQTIRHKDKENTEEGRESMVCFPFLLPFFPFPPPADVTFTRWAIIVRSAGVHNAGL